MSRKAGTTPRRGEVADADLVDCRRRRRDDFFRRGLSGEYGAGVDDVEGIDCAGGRQESDKGSASSVFRAGMDGVVRAD